MSEIKWPLGIFGGTFDLPTNEHRKRVEQASDEVELLYVVPCGMSLGKIPMATPWERVSMTGLMVAELVRQSEYEGRIRIWTEEVEHSLHESKTVETVEAIESLLGLWGRAVIYVGADLIPGLPSWHEFDELVAYDRWIRAFPRDGYEQVVLCPKASWVEMEPGNGGSSVYRAMLARGESVSGKVPDEVARFAVERTIYTRGTIR